MAPNSYASLSPDDVYRPTVPGKMLLFPPHTREANYIPVYEVGNLNILENDIKYPSDPKDYGDKATPLQALYPRSKMMFADPIECHNFERGVNSIVTRAVGKDWVEDDGEDYASLRPRLGEPLMVLRRRAGEADTTNSAAGDRNVDVLDIVAGPGLTKSGLLPGRETAEGVILATLTRAVAGQSWIQIRHKGETVKIENFSTDELPDRMTVGWEACNDMFDHAGGTYGWSGHWAGNKVLALGRQIEVEKRSKMVLVAHARAYEIDYRVRPEDCWYRGSTIIFDERVETDPRLDVDKLVAIASLFVTSNRVLVDRKSREDEAIVLGADERAKLREATPCPAWPEDLEREYPVIVTKPDEERPSAPPRTRWFSRLSKLFNRFRFSRKN